MNNRVSDSFFDSAFRDLIDGLEAGRDLDACSQKSKHIFVSIFYLLNKWPLNRLRNPYQIRCLSNSLDGAGILKNPNGAF